MRTTESDKMHRACNRFVDAKRFGWRHQHMHTPLIATIRRYLKDLKRITTYRFNQMAHLNLLTAPIVLAEDTTTIANTLSLTTKHLKDCTEIIEVKHDIHPVLPIESRECRIVASRITDRHLIGERNDDESVVRSIRRTKLHNHSTSSSPSGRMIEPQTRKINRASFTHRNQLHFAFHSFILSYSALSPHSQRSK